MQQNVPLLIPENPVTISNKASISGEKLKPLDKSRKRNEFDGFDLSVIRQTIHNFNTTKKIPTLKMY
jgi:hypothetical protein